MAIFSRRTIQRLINENTQFLTKKQTKKHTDTLNLKGYLKELNINELIRIYFDTEWEIVLLNVFSKFGKVIHEPKFDESKRKLDILFSASKYNFKFLADITCITGKQDKDNLLLSFRKELEKKIDYHNLCGSWHIRVADNNLEVTFVKAKPSLKLVGKSEFETKIFNTNEFRRFIENIKKSPDKNHSYSQITNKDFPEPLKPNEMDLRKNEIINLTINYGPSKNRIVNASSYQNRAVAKLDNNEIYLSLKRKYEQLVETSYQDGFLGIILCNGNDNSYKRGNGMVGNNSNDVINNFLFNHKKIDFVLTVDSSKSFITFDEYPTIEIKLYQGFGIKKLSKKVINLFEYNLIKQFPEPARSVEEARRVITYSYENKEAILSASYGETFVPTFEMPVIYK